MGNQMMDDSDVEAYVARIRGRRLRRDADTARARAGADAIGRDAITLRNAGLSVSEIARRVQIPRPTLVEFINAAAQHAEEHASTVSAAAPLLPIPVLAGQELLAAVQHDGPVREIVASFDRADPLFMSQQPFGRFIAEGWANSMRIPHMMLRLDKAGWIGVDNVLVGYGGTGPSNALDALQLIGISDNLAKNIAYHRVSHVHLGTDGVVESADHQTEWPKHHLTVPRPVDDDGTFFCVKIRVAGGRSSSDPLTIANHSDGFYPTASPLTLSQQWLQYLDNPPAWLPGPEHRRGTLFTSPNAARAAGFTDGDRLPLGGPLGQPGSPYQLIIEQGPLQLWLTAYTSNDPSVWVPSEFHDVLNDASLLDEDIVKADEASAVRKLLTRHQNRRPASIPLGAGDATRPA